MGKIKVDQIEIESGNSIQLNNAVKIKSYDAAGISALTPASGDLIYDSDNSKLKVYTGSAWEEVGSSLDLSALDQSIIPDTDVTYDLGSATYKFRDLYLSGSSINLGDQTITSDSRSISLSGSLKLKQYTTSQIDALTGMTNGEMVFDTDENQVKIYDSTNTTWQKLTIDSGVTISGGVASADSTHNYYKFLNTGTFTVSGTGLVDILAVGGGGGGGKGLVSSTDGGGGGGGGVVYATNYEILSGTYTVTVGAGGATGANGSDTTLTKDSTTYIIAKGGGGGGQNGSDAGKNGGSGGGPSNASTTAGTSTQSSQSGVSGSSGLGFAGESFAEGGGGGAGETGGTDGQGYGGDGYQNTAFANATSTGADSGYYAGGGAAGSKGVGVGAGDGGGGSSDSENSTATFADAHGEINTGGGGAGVNDDGSQNGGSGGKGLFIIRVAI